MTNVNILVMETSRHGYDPSQLCARSTMTIGGLISMLESFLKYQNCSEETRIVFSNDNGYTYGEVDEYEIELKQFEMEDDEAEDYLDGYEELVEDEDEDEDEDDDDEDEEDE